MTVPARCKHAHSHSLFRFTPQALEGLWRQLCCALKAAALRQLAQQQQQPNLAVRQLEIGSSREFVGYTRQRMGREALKQKLLEISVVVSARYAGEGPVRVHAAVPVVAAAEQLARAAAAPPIQ